MSFYVFHFWISFELILREEFSLVSLKLINFCCCCFYRALISIYEYLNKFGNSKLSWGMKKFFSDSYFPFPESQNRYICFLVIIVVVVVGLLLWFFIVYFDVLVNINKFFIRFLLLLFINFLYLLSIYICNDC